MQPKSGVRFVRRNKREYPPAAVNVSRLSKSNDNQVLDMNSPYTVLKNQDRSSLALADTLSLNANATLRQEIADLKKMLVQSDKMAATGMLFAQFFHEASNHLMVISGNLLLLSGHENCMINRLLRDCKELEARFTDQENIKSSEIQTDLLFKSIYNNIEKFSNIVSEATAGSDQLCAILNDVKMFSRADMNQLVDVDMNERLNFISKMILSVHKNKISIIKDYRYLPLIKCSPQKIGQAFMNILLNAVQAIESKGAKGTIVVSTRYTAAKESNGGGGDWIEVIFSDTGCGIPKDKGKIIFEPFFSTKPVGLGLGLHITKEIIKECGGTIEIDSIEGQGTNVTVRIPAG
jgi:two-component system, NtrC family, sensor kinase